MGDQDCGCDYSYRCAMHQAIVDAEAAKYRLNDSEKRVEQLEEKLEDLTARVSYLEGRVLGYGR